jgi:hypothetical protein
MAKKSKSYIKTGRAAYFNISITPAIGNSKKTTNLINSKSKSI